MRGLVRVDRGVLDDGLADRRRQHREGIQQAEARAQERRAIEEDVQIAVGRGLDARDPRNRADVLRQILGDGARRLPQPPGQVEGDRRPEVAKGPVGRRLDSDRRAGVLAEPMAVGENRAHTRLQCFVQRQYHQCRFVDSTVMVRYALRAMSVDAGHVRGHLAFYSEPRTWLTPG